MRKKYLFLIYITVFTFSCKTKKLNNNIESICKNEIKYILANLYLDKTTNINQGGFVFRVFNYADPIKTDVVNFDGTGEVVQRFIVVVQPDGEYVDEYTKSFYLPTIESIIDPDSYRVTVDNDLKEFILIAKDYQKNEVINFTGKLPLQ